MPIKKAFVLLATCLLTMAVLTSAAWAGDPTIKTLYTFTGQRDGGTPLGGLAFDPSGHLYGSASSGGFSCSDGGNCGVVFELIPSKTAWTENVLYDFGDGSFKNPDASVILDQKGNLYSVSNGLEELFELSHLQNQWAFEAVDSPSSRGSIAVPVIVANHLFTAISSGPSSGGAGYIDELIPPQQAGGAWARSTIFTFSGTTSGGGPAGLIADKAGNLYGSASYGGTGTGCIDGSTCGLVYKLSHIGSAWQQTVLYEFQASDGEGSFSPLTMDGKGNLYGVIGGGGGNANCPVDGGCGLVFELSPSGSGTWSETVLHRFTGSQDDGSNPMAALAIDPKGNLYGTTEFGGSGFCNSNSTAVGCGTIFELSPAANESWTYTILHNYQGGSDGQWPTGNLIFAKGQLFGTNPYSGSFGRGTVFSLVP